MSKAHDIAVKLSNGKGKETCPECKKKLCKGCKGVFGEIIKNEMCSHCNNEADNAERMPYEENGNESL